MTPRWRSASRRRRGSDSRFGGRARPWSDADIIRVVPKRDPHDVLGIEPGASPAQVKAAWRRLARRHHPDLTGDDPEASRIATRRMAEINEAYAALTRGTARTGRRASWPADSTDGRDGSAPPPGTARRGGPPRPRATRPVTGRVDTTNTFRPRNQPLRPAAETPPRPVLRNQPPFRTATDQREPPRASTPTGPLNRSRVRNFRPPAFPPLADAMDFELGFGKFHGHTLGQVAAFEPSYIDWLASTITRDRELMAAARVVRDDLDRRGIVRRARPQPDAGRAGRSA
jgi:curved DNA-binding protein CbpA